MPTLVNSKVHWELKIAACLTMTLVLFTNFDSANADDNGNAITLRAIKSKFSTPLIEYIARNSKPFELDSTNYENSSHLTPKHVIEMLCGSFNHSYYTEFLNTNKLDELPFDKPLGRSAKEFRWPACLYWKPYPEGLPVEVKPNDTAFDICSNMTGAPCSEVALEVFFKKSTKKEANLNRLKPEQILRADHLTVPVTLVPKNTSTEVFIKEVQERAGKTASGLDGVQVVTEDGEIVVGMPTFSMINSGANDFCTTEFDEPFNSKTVFETYQFANRRGKTLRSGNPGRADIVVVDNGFFGADLYNSVDPFKGSPFPENFFKSDQKSIIAKEIQLNGSSALPINDAKKLTPGYITGHGTHITGLILGGPYFFNYRDKLLDNSSAWAEITTLNVANGSKTLIDGTQTQLLTYLTIPDTPKIVNFSISYIGQKRDVGTSFRLLVENGRKNLFIIAAGNLSEDVENTAIFPAALGGVKHGNVITVAALDGSGFLAQKSNYSDTAVDVAAPGCRLNSWIENSFKTEKISGTSQAAPIVTFAAALLRSLNINADAEIIKKRIIASGDLLPALDHKKTVYNVSLNIPKALYWFDDYISLIGAAPEKFLGNIVDVSMLRCDNEKNNSYTSIDNLWAIKSDINNENKWAFLGKNAFTIGEPKPCRMTNEQTTITFKPIYKIGAGNPILLPIEEQKERTLRLNEVEELIFKTEFQ